MNYKNDLNKTIEQLKKLPKAISDTIKNLNDLPVKTVESYKKLVSEVNLLYKNYYEENINSLRRLSNYLEKMRIRMIRVESYEEFINEILIQDYLTFFRGEKNTEYKLIPSLYRKLDKDMIFNSTSLEEQYKKFINADFDILKQIDFDFLSLMQHYGYSSPFIDFSKNPYIALKFAIGNEINNLDHDVVIYKIKLLDESKLISDKKQINNLLKDYNATIIRDRKKLDRKIINQLCPDTYFIDIQTNDRMRLQDGVFLFLNNFYIVQNEYIFTKLNDCSIINKYIIPKEIINANIDDIKHRLKKYMQIDDVSKFLENINQEN